MSKITLVSVKICFNDGMQRFSNRLQHIAKKPGNKTLGALLSVSANKSFAILFIVLMAVPALPIPTGGITHVFEIIVMLLALELIVGRQQVWLPEKWLHLKLPDSFWSSVLPGAIKLIRKLEIITKPRLSRIVKQTWHDRTLGLIIFVLSLFAFLAPPFSGLDTLTVCNDAII